ncbi:MAG: TonB-dependent receptor domain-containing protein, partial [Parvularculaceae bacterium]
MKQARLFTGRRLAVRAALLGGLSMSAFATAAIAQDEAEEDEIVVTGSRIRQNPLDASRPVLNVDSDAIERSGISNIGEILQRIPGSGGGLNSKVNSSGNFGNPPDGGGVGAGASEIDLRFLGSRRVLVLVDGLRWVNGSSASGVPGATDLNTIPTGIIERVEVLQDGASPIYGSDAIAGVVNIITKRKQDGFAASAQLGAFDETDGETQQYDLSFGAGNDRTDIFFAVQYVHQNSVSSADRDISDFPEPTLDECFVTCSSATPRGRFLFTDPNTLQALNITLNENFAFSGTNPVYNPLNPTGADFEPFTTADRFNFAPFNFLQIPSERFGFFTQVTHEVTDNINFRAKAVYNTRNSTNQAAPIPLFIGPEAGNGNRLDTVEVDVTNPFNPFGFTLGQSNTVFLARRLSEAGPRNFQQNVDTFYASATLDGSFDLGGREVFWDVNSLWSQNEANQIARGIVNSARLQQALGPIANCTGSCVPFNFFGGPGSITQAQLDFVTFNQQDSSEQELWDVSFNLSTTLFELPAGAVGIAAGYEHRDQSGAFNPDPIVAAGDSADIPAQPTRGAFNVEELYAETVVPLLADLPLVNILEGNFAIRYSDYSTGVSATTIKYGGRWKPTEDLTIRGGFTEGFRAASIGELFGTATRF